MAIDAQDFRRFFGSFPTAVSVVTTLDERGEPRGFTCSAVSEVSMEPPLLLICVGKGAHTLPALHSHGAFVVHVLAADGEELARTFASRSREKFADRDWRPSTAAGGAPVLREGVLGHAECTVTRAVDAGDHWIFLGRVDAAELHRERALLYHRGAFGFWEPAPAYTHAAG
ncbi:flavin reductase family protein [Streptomyces sp. NPDC007355]|uniref:flavin reductase family protein n=1 Tax=Streptomyces sp. NPDC007355 TaxID=3364778 RepID=UPI0036CF47B7